MHINAGCEKCLYEKQVLRMKQFSHSEKRKAYLDGVKKILSERKEKDTAPYMVYLFNKLFVELFGSVKDYSPIKREYNQLVLSMENELEKLIQNSPDPLKTALFFTQIGNYIDFGAMADVDKDTFLSMFNKPNSVDEKVYADFIQDCKKGNHFLLICDNCGEIVLDKLFIKTLKSAYPHLKLTAMVRGQEILNDATTEDAEESGLSGEITVIDNGLAVAGTIPELLPEKSSKIFENADVILSKGQGNYETLSGCGANIYYAFLCKCDFFTNRFNVPLYTGMLVKEQAE